MRRVWRTVTADKQNGYFGWEVREVKELRLEREMHTREGECILISCYHFWTEGAAKRFANGDDCKYFDDIEVTTIL